MTRASEASVRPSIAGMSGMSYRERKWRAMMADGSHIRDNPALAPIYCNRLLGIQWDSVTVHFMFGFASKFPKRMGSGELTDVVVSPVSAVSLPYQIAKDFHKKLGDFLEEVEKGQTERRSKFT
jgi:hypothetical protein